MLMIILLKFPHILHKQDTNLGLKLKSLSQCFPNRLLVVGISCGNGKYLGINPNTFMIRINRAENT